jgi:hypothetical protein
MEKISVFSFISGFFFCRFSRKEVTARKYIVNDFFSLSRTVAAVEHDF